MYYHFLTIVSIFTMRTAGDRILTLSRVCLHANKGQLISVVGQVGSGKSSLLSALLGMLCLYYTTFITHTNKHLHGCFCR